MSGTAAELRVDSATGVAVRLDLVGPGGRCVAFLIDWHIRLLLALCWYVVAALLVNLEQGRSGISVPLEPGARWFLGVVGPAAALYFLYHPVLELALRGRTPGKRMTGLRLVTRQGGAPTPGALLLRNLFRLIDGLPVLYGVGLVATMVTREHVRIGDLAAGTVLVYERRTALSPGLPTDGGALQRDPEQAALARELLRRWPGLAEHVREDLADRLLDAARMPRDATRSDPERLAALRLLAGESGA